MWGKQSINFQNKLGFNKTLYFIFILFYLASPKIYIYSIYNVRHNLTYENTFDSICFTVKNIRSLFTALKKWNTVFTECSLHEINLCKLGGNSGNILSSITQLVQLKVSRSSQTRSCTGKAYILQLISTKAWLLPSHPNNNYPSQLREGGPVRVSYYQ